MPKPPPFFIKAPLEGLMEIIQEKERMMSTSPEGATEEKSSSSELQKTEKAIHELCEEVRILEVTVESSVGSLVPQLNTDEVAESPDDEPYPTEYFTGRVNHDVESARTAVTRMAAWLAQLNV